MKKKLTRLLSLKSVGYSRHNYHGNPSEILHVTLLAIQANTCIIQHKSNTNGKQYYIAQDGELKIYVSSSRVTLDNSLEEILINEKSGASCINKSIWRRLENSSNSIVFYYEINTGPHREGDTKWM